MTIRRGEVFRHELAGAGGWGDPLERDPEAVLKDVRNELISLSVAANDYGVVIDSHNWKVDEAATQRLRTEIRRLVAGPRCRRCCGRSPPNCRCLPPSHLAFHPSHKGILLSAAILLPPGEGRVRAAAARNTPPSPSAHRWKRCTEGQRAQFFTHLPHS